MEEQSLPPLPEPKQRLVEVSGQTFYVDPTPGMYAADQMRQYALAAVLAERERAARTCEKQAERWSDDRANYAAEECAAAIRGQS